MLRGLKADLAVWAILLALAHFLIGAFLYREILILCGDSDTYLMLSRSLGTFSADRLQGMPFVLAAVRGFCSALGLAFAGAMLFLTHFLAWGASVGLAAAALRGVEARGKRLALLLVWGLACFAPTALLLHSAVLMADSLTLSLCMFALALLRFFPGRAVALVLAAVFAGAAALLRNGQAIASLFFVVPLLRFCSWRLAPLVLFSGLVLPFAYHWAARDSLGGFLPGLIGGRAVTGHVFPHLGCEGLYQVAGTLEERAALEKECPAQEARKPEKWENVWAAHGLTPRLDQSLGLSRADANRLYERWARRALLLFPGAVARAAGENFRLSLAEPVSENFRFERYPAFGCTLAPLELWNINREVYAWSWKNFLINHSARLRAADAFTFWHSRLLHALAFLFLLWPFVPRWDWPVFRRDPILPAAFLLAAAWGAIALAGSYFDTRHITFFAQLSFAQFLLFLSARWRAS